MHPRNRHGGRYDLGALQRAAPELSPFVTTTPTGAPTIDFSVPAAVEALNGALLKAHYGVTTWGLPPGYLCPAVPGRADYVHYAADLLAFSTAGKIPRGEAVRALDVGVGASCVYPIIGRAEYGWRFVGTDIDRLALENAARIVAENPALKGAVELRRQAPPAILAGVILPEDHFDLTLCNPPFNESREEAEASARRKWANLGRAQAGKSFGGSGAELWTPGGEAAFARRMVSESAAFGEQVLWFTTLLSKSANLPRVEEALRRVRPADTRLVEMSQGQKKSRLVAWTFLDERRRQDWRRRWAK